MRIFKANKKMPVVAGAAAALLSVALSTHAETFDRGKELYDNHCKECHEQGAHMRKNRKVATVQELRRRVSGWSMHSGLDWSGEDVEDVTGYLGRTYYQLIKNP